MVKPTKKSIRNLKKEFSIIAHKYVKTFCEKHDLDYNRLWVNGDIGVIIEVSDYYFNFNDVRYDIDNEVKPNLIFEWYDYLLDQGAQALSFENYLKSNLVSK